MNDVFSKLVIMVLASAAIFSSGSLSPVLAKEPDGQQFTISFEKLDIESLKFYPESGLTRALIETYLSDLLSGQGVPLTIDQLNVLGDELTSLYRQYGYKFHSVFVPPQTFENSQKLRLDVLEARLGDVKVRGDDALLNQYLEVLLSTYLNQPLYQPDIDKTILAIQGKYGIKVFSYYSRGSKRGEVRINLKASRTGNWLLKMNLDNFGSQSTGRDRATLTASASDVSGHFDSLSLGVQHAVDGESSTYGFINYELPFGGLEHSLGLSASNNQFEIGDGFEALGLEGDARLFSLSYQHRLKHTFSEQIRLGVRLDYKENVYDSVFNDPLLEQNERSESATVSASWHYRPLASTWSFGTYWSFSRGQYELENIGHKNIYRKLYSSQQFEWGLGSLDSLFFSTFKWAVSAQYARDKLTSFELLSASGAHGVRNVQAGYFGADRGALSHLEWWLPNLVPAWGSVRMSPFAYYDVAYAERLDSKDDFLTRVIIGGAGIGLQTTFKRQLMVSVSSSLSLNSRVSDNPKPERMDVLLKLNYLLSL